MAKKNKVVLMGVVSEILTEDKSIFTIQIRKNEKRFVYPIVVLGDKVLEYKDFIQENAVVKVSGRVETERKEDLYDCPNCGSKILDKYIFTTVNVENITLVLPNEEGIDNVYGSIFENQVILLGTVCRDIDFKYIQGTKSEVANTKYQIAVNRQKKGDIETDYPWIASFARQGEEDARRLGKGSQVLVDGFLNTRRNTKECTCEHCETSINITEFLTEVVTNSVEYLNNCNFNQE